MDSAELTSNKESRGTLIFLSTQTGEEKNVKGDENISLFLAI
jgi:hypothetical protein